MSSLRVPCDDGTCMMYEKGSCRGLTVREKPCKFKKTESQNKAIMDRMRKKGEPRIIKTNSSMMYY